MEGEEGVEGVGVGVGSEGGIARGEELRFLWRRRRSRRRAMAARMPTQRRTMPNGVILRDEEGAWV